MTPELSIIIPAFNEASRLPPTLDAIRQYVLRAGGSAEVVVVDDGSTDGTASVAVGMTSDAVPVRVLVNDTNRGKGHSVRRGVMETRGAWVLMVDADLSTPMEELSKLWAAADRGAHICIGSRDQADSVLDPPQTWLRRVTSRAFRELRRRVVLPELYDTQCGFKLFRGEVAREVFPAVTTPGFAFDVEVLYRARRLGYAIAEVGVLWRDNRDSRVRTVRDGVRMLRDVLALRQRVG